MKHFAIFLLLAVALNPPAGAQEVSPVSASKTVESGSIERVEISGVPEQSLSSSLREDLQRLVGQLYDATIASQFADRIQSELAQYLAAPRAIPGTQPGRLRLIFVVGRISDESALPFIGDAVKLNINAQYTVEAVEFDGVPRSRISDALYGDMQKMVGRRLDNGEADELRERLASELKSEYQVFRRVRRGTEAQRVKIVYRGRRLTWLPSRRRESFIVYHSKEGFSGAIGQGFGQNEARINWELVNSADELVERYAGWSLGFESLRVGRDRLGLKLDYSIYRTQWERQTTDVVENNPGTFDLYRLRRTLTPSLAFAFNRNLFMTAGASISELQMPDFAQQNESVRSASGSLHYRRNFERPNVSHAVGANYEVRAGTHALGSDFVYSRHSWDAHYGLKGNQAIPESMITFDFQAGVISGNAPLFERFTLGDTRTLRGWNKFDVAPIGGSRVVHGSVGYRYKMLQLFYDAGSVWDSGSPSHLRQSAGFGLRETANDKRNDTGRCFDRDDFFGCWFINVGIPIRSSRLEPTITIGIGF